MNDKQNIGEERDDITVLVVPKAKIYSNFVIYHICIEFPLFVELEQTEEKENLWMPAHRRLEKRGSIQLFQQLKL